MIINDAYYDTYRPKANDHGLFGNKTRKIK